MKGKKFKLGSVVNEMIRKKVLGVLLVLFLILSLSFVLAQGEAEGSSDDKSKSFNEVSSDILSKEINVPENLQTSTKILFGLKREQLINLQTFVVLTSLWFLFIILFHGILELTPFFEGWKAWLGAVVVTTLISITGSLRSAMMFFFDLGSLFGILERWPALAIIVTLTIIFVFAYGVNKLLKIFEEKTEMEKSYRSGVEIAKVKAFRKGTSELN